MPELAEVEYYRRQWSPGLRRKVLHAEWNARSRVFRGAGSDLMPTLGGATLLSSQAHGKQMLFRFTNQCWLGIHLGMTGSLRVEANGYARGRHDHLVLRQDRRVLVFHDPRQFGRIRWDRCAREPEWWRRLPPAIGSASFTREWMERFLDRHERLPLKAALLHQGGFPGVGNWMADEILWRAALHPARRVGAARPAQRDRLWKALQFVARGAVKHISPNFDDPPRSWFYHQRWTDEGRCPKHARPVRRATVGGRTTAWCPACQHD